MISLTRSLRNGWPWIISWVSDECSAITRVAAINPSGNQSIDKQNTDSAQAT